MTQQNDVYAKPAAPMRSGCPNLEVGNGSAGHLRCAAGRQAGPSGPRGRPGTIRYAFPHRHPAPRRAAPPSERHANKTSPTAKRGVVPASAAPRRLLHSLVKGLHCNDRPPRYPFSFINTQLHYHHLFPSHPDLVLVTHQAAI